MGTHANKVKVCYTLFDSWNYDVFFFCLFLCVCKASSYLVSFNFNGGAILERYVLGPQVGYNLIGISKQGQSAGIQNELL